MVKRPNNEDYAYVWDSMSDNEKRWSFIFDVVIISFFVGLFLIIGYLIER